MNKGPEAKNPNPKSRAVNENKRSRLGAPTVSATGAATSGDMYSGKGFVNQVHSVTSPSETQAEQYETLTEPLKTVV